MSEFNLTLAISLAIARTRMRGRGGKLPAIQTVRRWANPKRGCRPAGEHGPLIVLRTVKFSGEILTMPEWVAEFEAERVRLGTRENPPLPRTSKERRRADEAAERRLNNARVGGDRCEK